MVGDVLWCNFKQEEEFVLEYVGVEWEMGEPALTACMGEPTLTDCMYGRAHTD